MYAPEETPEAVTCAPSAPSAGSGSAAKPRATTMPARSASANRLTLQLREVLEELERLRIRERVGVRDRHAVHHRLHRELDHLAVLGTRDVGHRHDARRNVPRRGVAADLVADTLLERRLEPVARPELDEQDDARVGRLVGRPELADGDRFLDL